MMLGRKSQGAGGHSVETGIRYVGGATGSSPGLSSGTWSVSLTSLTGGIATEPASGDLVIVYYGVGASVNHTLTISGYTSISSLYQNDTYDANLAVFYKRFSSTPDTSVVLNSVSDSSASLMAAVQVWRGVASPGPFDATATEAADRNSVLCNPPSITPSTEGAFIVSGGAGAHAAGTQTYSSSDLSGFISVGQVDTYNGTVGAGYYEWTSGTFDPAEFSFSGADNRFYSWCAVTLALKPA